MRYGRGEARTWVRANMRGYMTVLYTPFDPAGEIDEAGLRHNVEETLRRPGVGGLSVNSIHQEFWTFTHDERRRLVDIVLETVAGRVPVVVGCSDPSARNVIAFARHAERAGADLVMVWPPYYGPRTPAGVRAFYEQVAEAIDIGMVVYCTTLAELGYHLAPDQVEGLLHLPQLCAVQDTTLNDGVSVGDTGSGIASQEMLYSDGLSPLKLGASARLQSVLAAPKIIPSSRWATGTVSKKEGAGLTLESNGHKLGIGWNEKKGEYVGYLDGKVVKTAEGNTSGRARLAKELQEMAFK